MRRFSEQLSPTAPKRSLSRSRSSSQSTDRDAASSAMRRNTEASPAVANSAPSLNYNKIFDDPAVMLGYDCVPIISVDTLPRGGVSLETKSVGSIQFGIPPETIKDSMALGMEVPSVYIVPLERFCREMGPALGINVAEFEFPAYFNYFVKNKKCTLVVDSVDAEDEIRNVFGETLLGPKEFRDHDNPLANIEEDFDPTFARDKRPNFYKEFFNFRTSEASTNYNELTIDTLLDFCHFQSGGKLSFHAGQSHNSNGESAASSSSGGGGGATNNGHERENSNGINNGINNGNSIGGKERLGVPPMPTEFLDLDDADPKDDHATIDATTDISSTFSKITSNQDPSADAHTNGSIDNMDEHQTSASTRPRKRRSRRRHSLLAAKEMEEQLGAISESELADENRRYRSDTASADGSAFPSDAPPPPPPLTPSMLAESPSMSHREGRRGSMPGSTTEGRQTPTIRRSSIKTPSGENQRRGSLGTITSESATSRLSTASQISYSVDMLMEPTPAVHTLSNEDDDVQGNQNWMYSQVKWLGEVATVYPKGTTDEQKRTNATARAEIFKMAGGTEYIIHDVNKDGIIVGKARISGTVKVPDQLSVEGFLSPEMSMVTRKGNHARRRSSATHTSTRHRTEPPTFHPPSFGVTVLGNSHGFDMKGSTSGYVLWINGRGIMIDPPPFSSATLEREGIRPQTIVAIIITHCHADHDAGAFQKIMTGSRVAIITTPTIYNSFIRKYSALSGLRASLLRHSHRHRPAIIGQPLRFQGAVFHFTYTLHTIPCISFKVEWRGRSIVFTGDHLNNPSVIDSLQHKGVLTKARADDLRNLPLQPCDVLLHEAGAPPIHTPLSVLQELPPHVKQRLYVVHTAAIPADSDLRVAPTGTKGTIRLDSTAAPVQDLAHSCNLATAITAQTDGAASMIKRGGDDDGDDERVGTRVVLQKSPTGSAANSYPTRADDDGTEEITNQMTVASLQDGTYPNMTVIGNFSGAISDSMKQKFMNQNGKSAVPPLVFLRPTCVSDSWFILNLLSAVPFFSTLSYAHTMEILEIAQIEMYAAGETVVEGYRRPDKLCVFWEGTCVERDSRSMDDLSESYHTRQEPTIWHAGDWTGPISLQPDANLAAATTDRLSQDDIIAVSSEGIKVIVLMMNDLHKILKTGSALYRKFLEEQEKEIRKSTQQETYSAVVKRSFLRTTIFDGVIDVVRCNSVLGRLPAVQKRHLESLAEGPNYFEPFCSMWMVGQPVEHAYLIVKGTATFGMPRMPQQKTRRKTNRRGSTGAIGGGASMAMLQLQSSGSTRSLVPSDQAHADKVLQNVHPDSEYSKLAVSLQLRRQEVEDELNMMEDSVAVSGNSSMYFGKTDSTDTGRTNQDRHANKVLARLYSRRALADGLVFSRGMFLSDSSRMISDDLARIHHPSHQSSVFAEHRDSVKTSSAFDQHCHTSNLIAGASGCIVFTFPRGSLLPFLDGNPGVLLALLGTQVVV